MFLYYYHHPHHHPLQQQPASPITVIVVVAVVTVVVAVVVVVRPISCFAFGCNCASTPTPKKTLQRGRQPVCGFSRDAGAQYNNKLQPAVTLPKTGQR